jgi:hypothetical protein
VLVCDSTTNLGDFMSYGVDAPWGLRPMMKQGGSTFDMAETYPIKSGQPTNIFTGDLVCLNETGYLVPINPLTTSLSNTNLPIGVFVGCQYSVPAAQNPTNLFQMNPMWSSGTVTYGHADAIAYVITDPSVLFNVQANNTTALVGTGADSIIGGTATVNITTAGNTSTGQSGMRLQATGIQSAIGDFKAAIAGNLGSNQYPLKIRGVVQVPGNTLTTPTTTGINYVNLIVSLNNSVYQTGQISV